MSATTAIKLFSSLSVLWAALGLFHKAPPPADPPSVTVLCYHTFDNPKINPYTIDTRRLDQQMRFLAVQHIPVIPLSQLVSYLQGQGTLPERSVVITIDDGYKTAKTKAWPVMRRYGFPFTIYIYVQAIDRHGAALTWEDVRDMEKAGVDVESHSYTHPLLTHPGHAMDKATYRAWLDHELIDSKKEIEQHIHKPVLSLAFPFGGYDELVVEKTKAAGYTSALTCDDGEVTRTTDAWHLNRRLVFHATRLKEFAAYFRSKPLLVSDLTPRDGQRITGPPDEIAARVLNVPEILPETARILVDKIGHHWMPASIDQKSGILHFPVPKTDKRGYYFVSIMARDRALPKTWREASWLFIVRLKHA